MCETMEVEMEVEVKEVKEFYKIHESRMEELEKKLKRIQKKCSKNGNEFHYEITGSEMVDVETDKKKESNFQKYFIIKAEGKAIINDWEFIATLEPRGDENVIRRYNQEVEIPERFRYAKNICEHCNTNRMRKDLYVVRNVITNEFKQIGRQCLAEYTRGLSAEFVANCMEWKDMLKSEEDDSLSDGFIGGIGSRYHEVKKIIGYAYVLTNLFGFGRSDSSSPTKYRLSDMLNNEYKAFESWLKYDSVDVSKKDFDNDEVNNKADEIIAYYLGLEDDSEFIRNVQVIMKDGYCSHRDFGILCAIPYCYDKALGKIKAKEVRDTEIQKAKENDAKSVYFGEEGKRYKVNGVNVTKMASFDTLYGTMNIYKIVDADNHVLIWKSSTWQNDGQFDITFTVKTHTDYNGVMQTEVTRCKLAEVVKIVEEVEEVKEVSGNTVDEAINDFLKFCDE